MTGFRKEKSNTNLDDLKVMVIGTLLAIFIMVGAPTFSTLWDDFVSHRPFITSTVKVVKPLSSQEPMVLYDVSAMQAVDGFWIASIVDEEGIVIFTRRGEGSYSPDFKTARLWTWEAFFDNDRGLNNPGIPNVPFQVCVRYIVKTRDTGSADETPNYCSEVYSP